MRMAEMVSELIAAIIGKLKTGDAQEASRMLNRIYYDVLKEDASFFTSIPEEELTITLLQDHNYTNGHLMILAELFLAEAELSKALGKNSESLNYFRKALVLFEFTDSEEKTFSQERINKMDAIRKSVDSLNIVS